jgi:hypothetical protein
MLRPRRLDHKGGVLGTAFIEFRRESDADLGSFAMIALSGWLHCFYGVRDGLPAVEFTWQATDEGDERCGRAPRPATP